MNDRITKMYVFVGSAAVFLIYIRGYALAVAFILAYLGFLASDIIRAIERKP